jgi:tRNA (guanine-N7-)-methyltransferase
MLWLGRLLQNVPDGLLHTVTIQFPDPWFKKKHAKRRMVNAELAETIVGKLAPGGEIFVQTDIEFLAVEMFELFRSDDRLRPGDSEANPFRVKTERELAVERKNLPVYRRTFQKEQGVQSGPI